MDQTEPRRKSVVIVDDDPILCAIASMFFQKRGWSPVRAASNGEDALAAIDSTGNGVDFILCDLNMPRMDGVEFLRHLKERAFRGTIVILSGENDAIVKSAQSLAVLHGLDLAGALKKPLRINDLEALVDRVGIDTARTAHDKPILLSVNDLRIALASGHIAPHYQPKVETKTGAVVSVEALARWQHPGFGMVMPGHFITMAERNGLICELTEAIIGAAVHDANDWRRQGIDVGVSINLSAETLNDLAFPDDFAMLLAVSGFDPSRFVLEITESNLVEKTAAAAEVLTRLRIMGFGISIDDFGTGYSNMEQLREFPFSELKIDRSFIHEASRDRFARASVEASISLGKQLDLKLVAEGVETGEDWDFVVNCGIDEVQGYYIARPMPADAFVPWYRERMQPQRAVV
jgi:EAL domain-containing protein (putative c-di-GMP-specific phosphodiesterase class I)